MLVDFVKVALFGAKDNLLKSKLEFIGNYNTKTLEILDKEIEAKFKGLTFRIFNSGYVLMTGSLHKFYNNGVQNHSEFSFDNLKTTLKELEKSIGINLKKAFVQNIEFGLNLNLNFNTDDFLNDLLIHRVAKFKDVAIHNGNYRQALHSQYLIKVYNKAKQYSLNRQLLRYEIKVNTMEKLNGIGIKTLSDLLNANWISPVSELLLDEWNKILAFETPKNIDLLKPNQRNKKRFEWSNSNYWLGLSKQERNRQKSEFMKYVNKHTINRKGMIEKLLRAKLNQIKKTVTI